MLRALFLFLRLLLGFISSTQDGADGLISEPSRGAEPCPDPGRG